MGRSSIPKVLIDRSFFSVIKEWTILAIRNLCEDNLENQKFVASLSKVGDAENSLVTEYNAEGGTIRISSR